MLTRDTIKRVLDFEDSLAGAYLRPAKKKPDSYQDTKRALDTSHIHQDWQMPTAQEISYARRQLQKASRRTDLRYQHPTR